MLRARDGDPVTVRFVEPRDAEELQRYFRVAVDPLPLQPLPRRDAANCRTTCSIISSMSASDDRFSVIATMKIDGFETIVGEARYAFHAETESFEFGLSIDDRWQGQGIGSALLRQSGMPRRGVRRARACSAIPCAPTRR